MTTDISQKKCTPCESGTTPLKGDKLKPFTDQLGEKWQVMDEHHLEREYKFSNFREALDFTIRVGELAEQEGHHPDIYLSWGKVRIQLCTHSIGGLSENDFILAAKIDHIR